MASALYLSAQGLLPVVHDLFAAELGRVSRQPMPTIAPSVDIHGLGLDQECIDGLMAKLVTMFGMHAMTPSGPANASPNTLSDLARLVDQSWDRNTITFFTSGSTGVPRPCPHDYDLFVQEIEAQAEVFAGRTRILSCVPSHHIYGFLFTVMLPLALGVGTMRLGPMPTSTLGQAAVRGDLIVAFPLYWRKIHELRTPFDPGVQGVTSTGPCPPETIVALQNQGIECITEVYGSSETGGIGWRRSVDSPYRFYPYWRPKEQGGQVVSLVRALPGGEMSRPYTLPDWLTAHPPEGFLPLGRRDDAVQVAGMNVFVARVIEILLTHPDVAECAVRLMRPEEGDRLKAFIVLKDGRESTPECLHDLYLWLSSVLSPPEIPRLLTFGDKLPKSDMGKQVDW